MRKTQRLSLESLQPYLLDVPRGPARIVEGVVVPAAIEPVDWSAVYGNDRPVEIEVGFGKGLFLVTAGSRSPDVNFLGIEVMRKLQLYAATRLAKRRLANVRVACTDARWFLRALVPTGSVRAIHVLFPDPWWKKRHAKRRVFTAEFAASCAAALPPGGRLHIATDVPAYYAAMRDLADALPAFRLIRTQRQDGPPQPGELLTNFERKARVKGTGVDRATYERVAILLGSATGVVE